jgi:hypothetical protein
MMLIEYLPGVLKNKIILFLHRTLVAVLAIAAIDIPISSTATGKSVLKSDVLINLVK